MDGPTENVPTSLLVIAVTRRDNLGDLMLCPDEVKPLTYTQLVSRINLGVGNVHLHPNKVRSCLLAYSYPA
jgi:hypothetical protein